MIYKLAYILEKIILFSIIYSIICINLQKHFGESIILRRIMFEKEDFRKSRSIPSSPLSKFVIRWSIKTASYDTSCKLY